MACSAISSTGSSDYLGGGTLAAVGPSHRAWRTRFRRSGRDHRREHRGAGRPDAARAAASAARPAPIRAIRSLRPDLPQIACFDTAFHHGLRRRSAALPSRAIRGRGHPPLRLSRPVVRIHRRPPGARSRRSWPPSARSSRHLGNGASLCAMRDGKSVDTTMGFTPLDGLVMGTRCGAIDPGVLLYLLQDSGMSRRRASRTCSTSDPACSASPGSPPTCGRCSRATIRAAARGDRSLHLPRRPGKSPRWPIRWAGWNAWSSPAASASTAPRSGSKSASGCSWLGVRIDASANDRRATNASAPRQRGRSPGHSDQRGNDDRAPLRGEAVRAEARRRLGRTCAASVTRLPQKTATRRAVLIVTR